jgi:hypothetical protein
MDKSGTMRDQAVGHLQSDVMDFDINIAVQAGITGTVDLARAADAERGLDFVAAKSRVGGQREWFRRTLDRRQAHIRAPGRRKSHAPRPSVQLRLQLSAAPSNNYVQIVIRL